MTKVEFVRNAKPYVVGDVATLSAEKLKHFKEVEKQTGEKVFKEVKPKKATKKK